MLVGLMAGLVAVIVTVGGQLRGELRRDNDALHLAPEMQPNQTIEVILPVLVNGKKMYAHTRLAIYEAKAAVPENTGKKRVAEPINVLGKWKSRAAIVQLVAGALLHAQTTNGDIKGRQ